jgi:hypothetical protein
VSPKWLNVRATTFGIYLIHPILLLVVSIVIVFGFGTLKNLSIVDNIPLALLLSIVTFGVVYFGSIACSLRIGSYPRLRWMVGRFPYAGRVPASGPVATAITEQSVAEQC